MIKDIAIIGAGGFIGQHLCEELLKTGAAKLHLYGKKKTQGQLGNFFSQLDFEDTAQLRNVAESADLVYYLASETIPSTSWNDPFLDIDKNLKPFVKFLETTGASKLKKVVFVSSAGTVYGATVGKVPENAEKKPFSPYGIIKLTMENFLEYYRHRFGLNYEIFRVSNVYGPGQNTGKGLGIINTFIEKIINRKNLEVFGDGSTTRNYIYVKDVAKLMASSAERLEGSDIYNLASNSTVTINELLEIIRSVVSEQITVDYIPGRQSDNSFIDLDNKKIREMHPSFDFTSLQRGISETYKSIKVSQKAQ